MYLLFNGLILSIFVIGGLSLTFTYQVRFYFQELVFVLSALLMFYTGKRYLRSKELPVRYYFLAIFPLFFGIVVLLLMLHGIIQHSFFSRHFYQIGFGIELLLTALNLGERFNVVKAEKETAEEKQKLSEQVVHITSSFSSNVELRTACQVLAENIATFIQFDALFVFLRKAEMEEYHIPFYLNDSDLVEENLLQKMQTLIQENEYSEVEEIEDIREGIKHIIILPLTFKEKTGGYVLCFNRKERGVPSQTALDICANVVAQSSIALQKADLWTQLKESREKFGLLKEELDQFTYMVSHDLREPLRNDFKFYKSIGATL